MKVRRILFLLPVILLTSCSNKSVSRIARTTLEVVDNTINLDNDYLKYRDFDTEIIERTTFTNNLFQKDLVVIEIDFKDKEINLKDTYKDIYSFYGEKEAVNVFYSPVFESR